MLWRTPIVNLKGHRPSQVILPICLDRRHPPSADRDVLLGTFSSPFLISLDIRGILCRIELAHRQRPSMHNMEQGQRISVCV